MPDRILHLTAAQPNLADVMHQCPCPACGHFVAVNFYDGGRQPLTTLAWPKSTDEAQTMERLPLSFVRCVECGHVYNREFNYQKVPYSDKPNLMYNQGAIWQEHLAETQALLLESLPENPVVIEIGAGNGHFLKALAEKRPGGRYIAYDPNGAMDTRNGLLEFYPELFEPARHMAEYRPDLIICRHMLEHLENPLAFIQALSFAASWEELNTSLFVEVPCIDRVFATRRTVDFFYEHNSHFTSASLQKLMLRSGSVLECVETGYDGEVVYSLARLGADACQKAMATHASGFYQKARQLDEKMVTQLKALAQTGKSIAVWGGTGKSATFINRYQVTLDQFPVVVDSDPEKVGTYVPGTGQLIQEPSHLKDQPTDVIIITTQWRARDIALEIERRGIRCQSLLLEYQGKLVDFYRDTHPYRYQPDSDIDCSASSA